MIAPFALAGAAALTAVAGATSMRRAAVTVGAAVDESRARFRMLSRTLAHDLIAPMRGVAQCVDRMVTCIDRDDYAGARKWAISAREDVAQLESRVRSLSQFFHKSNVTTDKLTSIPLSQALKEARTQVPKGLAVHITGDIEGEVPQVLGNVIGNLLSNAKRYSRRNTLPRADINVTHPGLGILRITVHDNGIGFDPAKAEEIFEPFRRLDPKKSNGGTGIGLAIVQHIVDQIGGSIYAASEGPGQGATFVLEIPCGT